MFQTLFLAVFLLSPISFSNNTSVIVNGKIHLFNQALYERIGLPDLSEVAIDGFRISHLSELMPFLYQRTIANEGLPFRNQETYIRLINGTDLRARTLNQLHCFYVFRDKEGEIQGYIHGWLDMDQKQTIIDELVVAPEWRRRGISKMLLAKALNYFQTVSKDTKVTLRVPLSKKISEEFGVEVVNENFETSFIVDHLLSRFSLQYLMYRNPRTVPLHKAVALELKETLIQAEKSDSFSIPRAMTYLGFLSKTIDEEIRKKMGEGGFYYGIQNDKYELANVYFLMTILSFLSNEDIPVEQEYFHFRYQLLQQVVDEMRQGQREGGLLPVNYQLFIARFYAFIRFLHEEEIDSIKERSWIQKSIFEYLKVLGLTIDGPRDVFVTLPFIETAVREVLWFYYNYEDSFNIAKIIINFRSKALKEINGLKENPDFEEEDVDLLLVKMYQALQQEVWFKTKQVLKPQFGWLFIYITEYYAKNEIEFQMKIPELLFVSLFYTDSFNTMSLVNILAETGLDEGILFSDEQMERMKELMRYFTMPFNPPTKKLKESVVERAV